MTSDPQAPATKQDIHLIMIELGRMYDANAQWKEEILEQFHLAVETIRSELRGANRDEIEHIKDRVTRLERHTGLRAA